MIYTHTTTLDNLHKILNSGRIKSVRHIANEDPDSVMNVESSLGMRTRKYLKAVDALKRLKEVGKNPDKIFLTREGHNGNYGDVFIAKNLQSPKEHNTFNFVPNEYTIRRPLSVKHNATVYVPAKHLQDLRDAYKHIKFKPDTEFEHRITITDRFNTLKRKLFNKTALENMSDSKLKQLLHTNKAFNAGSTALGTNIGKSDTDIFIPYKTQKAFDRKVKQLVSMYPDMQVRTKPNKVTLYNDKVDLVVGHGDNAIGYANKFKELKHSLSDSDKDRIKKRKADIKNSWFFPEFRYKRYKKQVAKDLGLHQFYF